MAEILFASCREWPDLSNSDRILAQALERLGHAVRAVPWNEPPVERFQRAGLVLLRSNWDYYRHPDDFRKWVDDVAGFTRLLNPAPLVHWNLHKSYLLELMARGMRVPRSILLETASTLDDIYDRNGWSMAVVKPAYGASGASVELVRRADIPDWESITRAGARGADEWIVQEFIPEVQTEGELSIVFLDGAYSHAVRKTPRRGEFRSNWTSPRMVGAELTVIRRTRTRSGTCSPTPNGDGSGCKRSR